MSQIKLFGKTNIQGKTIFATENLTPTYTITRSASSVDEGSSITFTLSTTNVANGTVLPYTISGISANDVTSGSLTGSFTVNGGTATTTITMSADQLTEGAETATLTLNNGAASNFVVVNDTSIFTPNLISGLQLWLDASDTSTLYDATVGGSLVTTDGSAVARWQDKSGNSRHATQATVNARPLLKTNIKNGRSVLRFDASNDKLAIASSTATFNFLHNSTSTIFAVCCNRRVTTNLYNFWVLLDNCATAATKGVYIGQGGSTSNKTVSHGILRSTSSNVVSNSSSATISANTFSLVTILGDPSQSAANRSTGFINGANQFNNNVSTVAQTAGNAGFNFTLGGQAGGSIDAQWNGDITEILIYNSVLTTVQRQQVESYLNSKWALY